MKFVSFVGLMICLSILMVLPVSAVAFLDPLRCIAGTGTPVTDYVYASGIPGDTSYYSCLITDPSDALSETNEFVCCDGLYTDNLTNSAGVWQHSCSSNALTTTHNANGTHTAAYDANFLITGVGGLCAYDNYAGVKSYYSMAFGGGDLTSRASAMWRLTNSLIYTPSTYTFQISPETVDFNGTYTATLTSSSSVNVREMTINYLDGYGQNQPMKNPTVSSAALAYYSNISGRWYSYSTITNSYSIDVGTTFPSMTDAFATMGVGEFPFTCNVRLANGTWLSFNDNLIVGSGVATNTTQKLTMESTDALSNALVSDTNFRVLNKASLLWMNVTATMGVYDFYIPYNSQIYIESIAGGYATSTKNWTVLPYPAYILKIPMMRTGTIAAANVSLNVVVLDGGTSGVFPNVNVRLSDGQVKFTSGAGVANFNVSAAKSYQIIGSYTGYNSATRTLTTGTGGTSQDTYLTLNRIVVTTAPTLPPGVTAVVTLDTRTNAQKDQAMMDIVREYAGLLIPVACLMTLLYMFGYKP